MTPARITQIAAGSPASPEDLVAMLPLPAAPEVGK